MDDPELKPTDEWPTAPVDLTSIESGWIGFVERHFERLLQLLITILVLIPAWYIIIAKGDSQPHLILGTNVVTGIIGFWIGTAVSSSIKDKVIATLKGAS